MITKFVPPRRPMYQKIPFQSRKQVYYLDNTNKIHVSSTTPSSTIQQAKTKNLCYKCKDTLFSGHKQVCKLSTKSQIQSLQEQSEEQQIMYSLRTEISDLNLSRFTCIYTLKHV